MNIVLKGKKMRNYRCSLHWFEHLEVSRFIHPSVILSFVSLITKGYLPFTNEDFFSELMNLTSVKNIISNVLI